MNSSSLRRAALPAVAVLTVGLDADRLRRQELSGSGGSGGSTLNGGGATSQANAEDTWRADFQKANGGTINYEEVGSGTGVQNFTSKAYSFAGSDAYLTSDQLSAAKKRCGGDALEVPAYVSPIAVAFNLSGVKSLNLDAKTIADIFDGKVTKWNDPEIAAQNSGAKLPSTTISTVHRSDESGTTFNFTDYLSKAGGGAWAERPEHGLAVSAKGGQGADGTSGVVGVAQRHRGLDRLRRRLRGQGRGTLGVVSIKVGCAFNAPTADGAAKVLAASPAAPTRTGDRHGHRHRPHRHGQGRLPADAGVLPASPARRTATPRRPTWSRVPELRRLQRGPAGRRLRRRAPPRCDRGAVEQGDGDRREDLVRQLIELTAGTTVSGAVVPAPLVLELPRSTRDRHRLPGADGPHRVTAPEPAR